MSTPLLIKKIIAIDFFSELKVLANFWSLIWVGFIILVIMTLFLIFAKMTSITKTYIFAGLYMLGGLLAYKKSLVNSQFIVKLDI